MEARPGPVLARLLRTIPKPPRPSPSGKGVKKTIQIAVDLGATSRRVGRARRFEHPPHAAPNPNQNDLGGSNPLPLAAKPDHVVRLGSARPHPHGRPNPNPTPTRRTIPSGRLVSSRRVRPLPDPKSNAPVPCLSPPFLPQPERKPLQEEEEANSDRSCPSMNGSTGSFYSPASG